MGLTFHFDTISDLAAWLERRAEELTVRASSARTQRDAHTLRVEAHAYHEVAEIIKTSVFASEAE